MGGNGAGKPSIAIETFYSTFEVATPTISWDVVSLSPAGCGWFLRQSVVSTSFLSEASRRKAVSERFITSCGSDAELDVTPEILGGCLALGKPITSNLDAHNMIVAGFPRIGLVNLIANVPLLKDKNAFEKAIGGSRRSLYRRALRDGKVRPMSVEHGGRIWKFAGLLTKAVTTFGDQRAAEEWMMAPAIGLNRERPIDLLSTPAGTALVETYLDQIEYGVFT